MKRERDKRRNFGVGDDQTDLSEREFLIRKVADLDQRVQNLSAPYMVKSFVELKVTN